MSRALSKLLLFDDWEVVAAYDTVEGILRHAVDHGATAGAAANHVAESRLSAARR